MAVVIAVAVSSPIIGAAPEVTGLVGSGIVERTQALGPCLWPDFEMRAVGFVAAF